MGTMNVDLAIAGEKVVIVGLALQVCTFLLFLVVATNFHFRMLRQQRSRPLFVSDSAESNTTGARWEKIMWTLYSVSTLILIRCIFRLVEYAIGNAGYLMAHESFLYIFDMLLMVIVLVLLFVLRPANYIPTKIEDLRSESEAELGSK